MLNKVFPPVCGNCGKEGSYLCEMCKKKLEVHPPICPSCHQYSQDFVTCTACQTTKEDFFLDGCVIGFAYNDVIKKAILKLKYNHRKHIATFLAQQISFIVESNATLQNHINNSHGHTHITSVPSHWIRHHFVKGYNQSTILAKNLSKELNIPYKRILRKKKHTTSQVKLNREQRKKNLKGAFQLLHPEVLHGDETILIVDDITTTGSTLNEMAQKIKTHFPHSHVRGIVLARHVSK